MNHERNNKFQEDIRQLLNNLKAQGVDVEEDSFLFNKLVNRYMFDARMIEFCSSFNIRNYQKYLELCEKSIVRMLKD